MNFGESQHHDSVYTLLTLRGKENLYLRERDRQTDRDTERETESERESAAVKTTRKQLLYSDFVWGGTSILKRKRENQQQQQQQESNYVTQTDFVWGEKLVLKGERERSAAS